MKRIAHLQTVPLSGATLGLGLLIVAALLPQPVSATLASCPVFPSNNIWNTRVDILPVHPRSNAYINAIGSTDGVHPDFGSGTWDGGPIGIPYTIVPGTQPSVTIHFTAYGDESDPGPYPIPSDAPVEWGSDHHVIVVDRDHCMLYEMYRAERQPDGSWNADSGAKFDLQSNALRPATWTSADAAGLPMLPGLVRYDEVASGAIKHALRFTANNIQENYVWPGRHLYPANPNLNLPPYGQRFRLKASFDISRFSPQVQVILTALKTYGMFLADNGSPWYISGAPNPGWNDDALVNELRNVKGVDFEAVDESSLMVDPNSGQARTTGTPLTPTKTPTFTPPPTHTATPTPTATTGSGLSTTYDDRDPGFVWSGSWQTYDGSGPYNNTTHYSKTPGNSVQFTFTGTGVSLMYGGSSSRGVMGIWIDGKWVTNLNYATGTYGWRVVWTYGGTLSPGSHTLRLVHAAGGLVDVDAIIVR